MKVHVEGVRSIAGSRMGRWVSLGLIGAMSTGLTGCQWMNEHRTATGAVAGTVVGATAGALISDDNTKGALIGGAVGAAVGGGIGYVLQRQKDRFDEIEGIEATEQTVYIPQTESVADSGGAVEGTGETAPAESVDLVPAQGLSMTISDSVLFAFDSSALTPQGTAKIGEIANVLKEFPDSDVFVMGYTSSDGDDAYNVQLSQRRADAVKNTLIANQVAASRITALGMGESTPVASNDTEEGRAQNRRVELLVVPRETAS